MSADAASQPPSVPLGAAAPGRRRTVLRRAGAVAALATSLAALPQALAVGFDGSGWDVVVVVIAVVTVVIAVGTALLVRPVWRGHRGACWWMAALQVVSALPAVPAFLLPVEEVGANGRLLASVGLLVCAAIVTLLLVGAPRRPA